MPTYLHLCKACNKEFEDIYSIKQDPPTQCPLCKTEGQVKRLVLGGSGMGIVKLSGRDLVNHAKSEAAKLKRDAEKDENLMANLIGEKKYHNNTTESEKVATDILNIL